ncbi:ArsR/SmtB family transcription factor [Halorarius halobius]|uniref:ArsR/SmtB family transcription factor n=1 Tax=Halorarius halobius TaxID=2962671 RepID=UPI0020CB770F|nr:helix-turn-helix domain-containing protein [Halorarius halobius]
MNHEWTPDDPFDVLADETARQILASTRASPRSARELADRCDGCLSGIYRRVEVLTEYDLLDEETRIDPDGHHHSIYACRVDALEVSLWNEEIRVATPDTTYTERHPPAEGPS